ncbi:MAG: hypothetical protein WC761_01965 [Candidatus Paceibacterota bacterium]|jgi:hypothetical protein
MAPINIKSKQKYEQGGLPDLGEVLTRRRRTVANWCTLHNLHTEASADEALRATSFNYSISNDFVMKVYQFVERKLQEALKVHKENLQTEADNVVDEENDDELQHKKRQKKSVKNDNEI